MKESDFLICLGKRIRALRHEKGLSQQQLATDCDFEKSKLSRIESGKTNPTALTLLKIAKVLKVEIYEIFVLK